jgi:hypothetical protein
VAVGMVNKAAHLRSPKHVNFIEKNESPLIKICEYPKYFEIDTILPNGDKLRVKKESDSMILIIIKLIYY